MSIAAVNGIEIAYETFGDGARTVVLIAGLGNQMLEWDERFCRMIAEHDCRVVRIDSRDMGLSTKFDIACPDPAAELARARGGEAVTPPYDLDDMADDTAALIADISDGPAHVVGRSMGGMIGQRIAVRHTDKIASLCSIASTTGNPDLPPPSQEAMALMSVPFPDDPEKAIDHAVGMDRFFTGPVFEFEEEAGRIKTSAMRARSDDSNGRMRHMLSFFGGDRAALYQAHRANLAGLKLPVCVIHGDADPLVNIAGGRETAESIPGARLVVIEGMGHELPAGVWPQIVTAIIETVDRGQLPI